MVIAEEVDKKFQFTYNRNVKINTFSPSYGLHDNGQSVIVRGENFHPHSEMKCKYNNGAEQVVDATYLTNKTMS